MRLEPFLVASLNSRGKWRMLEMGQTRVQNRLYFSSGNDNDLVSRMVEENGCVECGVVNWLLIEACCSVFPAWMFFQRYLVIIIMVRW